MYYYQQSNDLVKQQACASGMPLTSASFGAGNVIPVDDSKLGGVDLENGYYSQAVGSMLSQSLPSSSSSTRQHDGTVIEGFNMAAFDPRSQQFIDEVDNNSAAKQRSLNNVRAFSSLEANTADANRNKWVRVTDASGVSKYGYITRVGVFQVWFAPTTSNPADWLATDPVQKNVGFLGCPAAPTGVSPITIQKNWRQIQPYEIVYNNATPPAPVFYLTDVGVRDVSKSLNNSGNFSCGNEGANVWVNERPAAALEMNTASNVFMHGCYVLNPGKTLADLTGFTSQPDLSLCSIAACKRRAEDLGKSQFAMIRKSASGNLGECYVNVGATRTDLSSLLTVNSSKCTALTTMPVDEDSNFSRYPINDYPRYIGNGDVVSDPSNAGIAIYTLKDSGPSGIDPNGAQFIGKVSYITRSGERREYPSSLFQLGNQYQVIAGYDSNGNGYNLGNTLTNTSMTNCENACNTNTNCGGFSFSGPSNSGTCTLKDKSKVYPVGLRQPSVNSELYVRKPTFSNEVGESCRAQIKPIDSLTYQYYMLNSSNMTAGENCSIYNQVSQNQPTPDISSNWIGYFKSKVDSLQQALQNSMRQLQYANATDFQSKFNNIQTKMAGLKESQSTIDAMIYESNVVLISQTYKYILWTILAILVVIGVIKLKEKIVGTSDAPAASPDAGLGLGALGAAVGLAATEGAAASSEGAVGGILDGIGLGDSSSSSGSNGTGNGNGSGSNGSGNPISQGLNAITNAVSMK